MKELKQIFDNHYSPLCNYANALIHDYVQSEDIVQTIFIQLWENEKLLQLKDPAPYLIKCVQYKCIDHVRQKKAVVELDDHIFPDIGGEHELEFQEDDIEAIFAFLTSQLPPRTRQVFLMSRQQGMTYSEIAEELDVSLKTVENQMGNALKKLRDLLTKYQYLPALIYFL